MILAIKRKEGTDLQRWPFEHGLDRAGL